jgi:hypothetical protein
MRRRRTRRIAIQPLRRTHVPPLVIHQPRKATMRIGRTIGLLTLFAGLTSWFAMRAALRRQDLRQRTETEDMTRWETDGGATTSGPQPPAAQA